jgi:hypothetical protein
MHPVEIADCHGAATKLGRNLVEGMKYFHAINEAEGTSRTGIRFANPCSIPA